MMPRAAIPVLVSFTLLCADSTSAEDAPAVVAEMRQELARPSSDPEGRPLPVASHWAHGYGHANFGSDYQAELLGSGRHVLPNLSMPQPGEEHFAETSSIAREVVGRLARWKAPLSLRGGNWEAVMLSGQTHPREEPGRWWHLPAERSPHVIDLDGQITKMISPLGAVEPWREAGRYLSSSGAFRELQQLYPDPPCVVLLSNNEAPRLEPKHDIEALSKRYRDRFGLGKPASFQRQVMGAGYVERYRAMFAGFRAGLVEDAWRKNSVIVGYGAFGPSHLGRFAGWDAYSFTTEEEIDIWHLAWDGGSPSYYTHNWNDSTDYRVHSPQVEANNWVFMLKEVYRERPDFWFELSVWDGNFSKSDKGYAKSKRLTYEAAGQAFTPERYAGFVQYGMWLTTPRVVREFRNWMLPRAEYEEHFLALVASVDRVWQDPVLRQFWRKSELVPNPARQHPYQVNIPSKWRDAPRWYLLNTSLDPQGSWKLDTEIPVFSLARVAGRAGERQWLVYAHSPLKSYADVEVELPGYGMLRIDATPAGNFYLVREADKSIRPIANQGT